MQSETKNHLISVIIPAYNEENYIEKTLISIKNSSYKSYEIIVVCDSCSDKTEQIAKKYTDKVFVVNFKNIAETRNYGVNKSEGDILVFSDADTTCSEDYLSSIVNAMNSQFDYGCPRIVSESGTIKGKFMIGRFNRYNRTNKTMGGNCFIKKDIFNKMKGFDTSFVKGEDTELGNRLRKSGAKYAFLNNTYITTSERRFQKYGYFNSFLNSMKDAFLYFFFKNKYKEIYKRKNLVDFF